MAHGKVSILKVAVAAKNGNNRRYHVFDQRLDHTVEGRAYHDADRQIHHVAP